MRRKTVRGKRETQKILEALRKNEKMFSTTVHRKDSGTNIMKSYSKKTEINLETFTIINCLKNTIMSGN